MLGDLNCDYQASSGSKEIKLNFFIWPKTADLKPYEDNKTVFEAH